MLPLNRPAFQRLLRALPFQDLPGVEQQRALTVLPWHADQWLGMLEFDAQLLAAFTRECREGRLTGLKLAAGKLPQSSQVLARWPLCQQHAPDRVAHDASHHVHDVRYLRDGFRHQLLRRYSTMSKSYACSASAL